MVGSFPFPVITDSMRCNDANPASKNYLNLEFLVSESGSCGRSIKSASNSCKTGTFLSADYYSDLFKIVMVLMFNFSGYQFN